MATLAEDPEFHLSKKLQPGDIEIIHNPTIFHARSEVVDGEVSMQGKWIQPFLMNLTSRDAGAMLGINSTRSCCMWLSFC